MAMSALPPLGSYQYQSVKHSNELFPSAVCRRAAWQDSSSLPCKRSNWLRSKGSQEVSCPK